MLSIYLNSLDNLLIRKNPFRLLFRQVRKNLLVVWNLRKNMQAANHKLMVMERRQQVVNQLVDQQNRHRLDLKR